MKYDREWTLINSLTSKILSQKQFPRMSLIKPKINLDSNKLEIVVGFNRWEIDLNDDEVEEEVAEEEQGEEEEIGICGDSILASRGKKGGGKNSTNRKVLDSIDQGLSEFLGISCRLLRYSNNINNTRHGHFDSSSSTSSTSSTTTNTNTIKRSTISVPILLSNESPFLCISTSSVDQVNYWIREDLGESSKTRISEDCFRANFIFSSSSSSLLSTSTSILSPDVEQEEEEREDELKPFIEDHIDFIKIGTETFSVLAKCRRCLMVRFPLPLLIFPHSLTDQSQFVIIIGMCKSTNRYQRKRTFHYFS